MCTWYLSPFAECEIAGNLVFISEPVQRSTAGVETLGEHAAAVP